MYTYKHQFHPPYTHTHNCYTKKYLLLFINRSQSGKMYFTMVTKRQGSFY